MRCYVISADTFITNRHLIKKSCRSQDLSLYIYTPGHSLPLLPSTGILALASHDKEYPTMFGVPNYNSAYY